MANSVSLNDKQWATINDAKTDVKGQSKLHSLAKSYMDKTLKAYGGIKQQLHISACLGFYYAAQYGDPSLCQRFMDQLEEMKDKNGVTAFKAWLGQMSRFEIADSEGVTHVHNWMQIKKGQLIVNKSTANIKYADYRAGIELDALLEQKPYHERDNVAETFKDFDFFKAIESATKRGVKIANGEDDKNAFLDDKAGRNVQLLGLMEIITEEGGLDRVVKALKASDVVVKPHALPPVIDLEATDVTPVQIEDQSKEINTEASNDGQSPATGTDG